MKRLLLALPLLLHLSGFTGVAAVVCATSSAPGHCCCHTSAASTVTDGGHRVEADAVTCRCTMKPRPAPVMPNATVATSVVDLGAELVEADGSAFLFHIDSRAPARGPRVVTDLSPPYLTSAPPRR